MKPETCEWRNCVGEPRYSVKIDGERFWFCCQDHKNKFIELMKKD